MGPSITRQREPIIFGVLAVASLGIQSEVGRYFKTLGEPHSADPLAMWCWEGERETSLYPIRNFIALRFNFQRAAFSYSFLFFGTKET